MKLVDADALKQECMHIDDIPAVTERDIDNAPTIDAIPVGWLIDRANDPERTPPYRHYAQMLIEEWNKGQEAR